jgi:hypothetical protein
LAGPGANQSGADANGKNMGFKQADRLFHLKCCVVVSEGAANVGSELVSGVQCAGLCCSVQHSLFH